MLAALSNQATLATVFCDVMFRQISPESRFKLDVPPAPNYEDEMGWDAVYRNVRTRLHGLLDLMDPSVLPKNRRLDVETFKREVEKRKLEKSEKDIVVLRERLRWFINRVLEASVMALRPEYRGRWDGSVCVDATVVPAYARPNRQASGKAWGSDKPISIHSCEPDAAWHMRTPDHRDEGERPEIGGVKRSAKKVFGMEATLVVSGDVTTLDGQVPLPALVVGMDVLHRPSEEPGPHATNALANVRQRGHPAGYLAGDRAYSNARPEGFQLPTRALGYEPVFDYRINQLGVQAEARGLVQVEGQLYCPMMPEPLVNAERDHRNDLGDEKTYRERLEARKPYRARPKGRPDKEGHQLWLCPASAGAPTARCGLKPASEASDGKTRLRIRLTQELREHPPDACRQQSIMLPPEEGAKFAQPLTYRSPDWERVYATLRNSIEGMNGFVKDSAFEGMGDPQNRRIRGVAAQSVLVAFQLMAANFRKIDAFLRAVRRVGAGVFQRPRRRRHTTPITDHLPEPVVGRTGGPSPPII